MHYAEDIKRARKAANLTQKQLAEAINKSFSVVQKYELGITAPPVDVLQAIASACGTSWSAFFYIDPNDPDDQKYFSRYIENEKVVLPELVSGENMISNSIKEDLLHCFSRLNEKGQSTAAERVCELTRIPEYQKDSTQEE